MSNKHLNGDDPGEGRRGLRLRNLAQLVVGLGALAIILVKSDPREMAAAIQSTRIGFLPMALFASLLVTLLMALRWQVILRARGCEVSLQRLFSYYLVGIMFMNFVPGGGISGDVARLVYVDREVNDKALVLSTIAFERIAGLFTLLLTGLVAMLASRGQLPSGRLFVAAEILLAAAVIGAAATMTGYVSSRLGRLASSIGQLTGFSRAGAAAARALEAVGEMRKYPGMIVATVGLSVVIRIVWSAGCYIVALAMGLPLTLPMVFTVISLVDVVRLMPVSVGGLGVREWAVVVLLGAVGIGQEQALMYSLLAFSPVLANGILGGIVYLSRAGTIRNKQRIREVAAGRTEL